MGTKPAQIGGPALDICAVLIFVGIGRNVHDHGVSLAGMASTSWPFLTGLLFGWVVARAWRNWCALAPAGICTWLCCVAFGLILRQVSGQGIAVPFVFVALGFLGGEMLGWRFVWRSVGALRTRSHPERGGGKRAEVA